MEKKPSINVKIQHLRAWQIFNRVVGPQFSLFSSLNELFFRLRITSSIWKQNQLKINLPPWRVNASLNGLFAHFQAIHQCFSSSLAVIISVHFVHSQIPITWRSGRFIWPLSKVDQREQYGIKTDYSGHSQNGRINCTNALIDFVIGAVVWSIVRTRRRCWQQQQKQQLPRNTDDKYSSSSGLDIRLQCVNLCISAAPFWCNVMWPCTNLIAHCSICWAHFM